MMKYIYSLFWLSCFLGIALNTQAQTVLSEDFEGGSIPATWTLAQAAGSDGWLWGDATFHSSLAVNFPAHTNFAASNDDECNCDMSEDYLITPALDFSTLTSISLEFDYFNPQTYGSIATVEVSLDGGISWAIVATLNPATAWLTTTVDLTPYAGNSSVLVGFHHDDDGGWADAFGVDDIEIAQPLQHDASMTAAAFMSEYTIIPINQTQPLSFAADVSNVGSDPISNVDVLLNVYDDGFSNIVYTENLTPLSSIAPGATATVTAAGNYTPIDTGLHIAEFIVSISQTDGNPSNDTIYSTITVSDSIYARDNGQITGSLGIGAALSNGILGQNFDVLIADEASSVTYVCTGPTAGDSTYIAIYATDPSGTPISANMIARTPTYVFTTADETNGVLLTQGFIGGAVPLNAGTYFFGIHEFNSNVTLATTTDIFTAGKGWVNWDTNPLGGWGNSEDFGSPPFEVAYVLRPNLTGEICLLSANSSVTDVLCGGGSTGQINVSINNASGPVSYSWDTGDTTQNLNNISAGIYSVTITDSVGCAVTRIDTVSEPTAINITLTNDSLDCNGYTDADVTSSVAGGTPSSAGYSYAWSTGATTPNLLGIGGGEYVLVITDSIGCTSIDTAIVYEPQGINPSITTDQITCFGDDDGAVSVSVAGGSGGYTYQWSHGPTTNSVSNLAEDTYTLTITDANNCSTDVVIDIIEPDSMEIDLDAANVSCSGLANANVITTVTGGTAPYNYLWSTGATIPNQNNLPAGTYTLVVSDDNGCTQTKSVTIAQPAQLSASANSTNVTCFGDTTATASITGNGGTLPYTYLWSNGETTQNISGLTAGTYTGIVIDANGCTATDLVIPVQPQLIELDFDVTNIECNGGNDGAIDLTATGGVGSFSYQWDIASANEDLVNLTAGVYTVAVTDGNGCVMVDSVEVEESNPIVITASTTPDNGTNTGTATAIASGGTPPYSYLWSTAIVQTTSTATVMPAGTYTVTVTDANGCVEVAEVVVDGPTSIEDLSQAGIAQLEVYPNPSAGLITLDLILQNPSDVQLSIMDANGRIVKQSREAFVQSHQEELNLSDLAAGVYVLQIRTETGNVSKRIVIQ